MTNPWDILGWILVALVGHLTLVVVIGVLVAALGKPKKKDKSTHIMGGKRD